MMRLLAIATFIVLLISACENNDTSDEYVMDEYNISVTSEMKERALHAYSSGSLRGAISNIEQWHDRNRTKLGSQLAPGLSDAEIDTHFEPLGCRPPLELRSLWLWRNGQPEASNVDDMVWYHSFLPIEEAMQHRKFLLSSPDLGWKPNWVPVFYFEQEWYFVECGGEQVDASPLLYYFPESGYSHHYTNITTYLATASEAMDVGAVYVDAEGYIEGKPEEIASVHKKHNPGLSFPYAVDE